jgi:DnaJ-class molecular chaperone
VKGQGVKHSNGEVGDLFAEVMVVVPKDISPDDREQLVEILKKYPQNPRSELRW